MEKMVQVANIRLRTADSNDVDIVYGLFAEAQSIHAVAEPSFFRKPKNDETFRLYFEGILDDPEQHLMVASADGASVGYIQYFLGSRPKNVFQAARRFAYIRQLVVTQSHRRIGCATALIEHAKDEARKQGIALLGVDFWSFNDAARACFEKNGFKLNQEFLWARV